VRMHAEMRTHRGFVREVGGQKLFVTYRRVQKANIKRCFKGNGVSSLTVKSTSMSGGGGGGEGRKLESKLRK
jgi:hypothetical protein